jgi:mono/diheme cytochrome c family protein
MLRSMLVTVTAATLFAAVTFPSAATQTAGLYSSKQAAAGATAYAQNCARCHGANLEGVSAPPLRGSDFTSVPGGGSKLTVHDIFKYMTSLMPAGNPGSLTHDQYAAVMAFILKENGNAAGSKALSYSAAMSSTAPIRK